ncbi:MAG: recombination protein RecR [Clostridia bacterium]|nr:recombination protein RecR [Clostridia bacterium]
MDTTKIDSLDRLTNEFSKLPGVGKKTAGRYAYYIVTGSLAQAQGFAEAILEAKEKVKFCSNCGNFADAEVCPICKQRGEQTICVVKEPKDVMAIEKAHTYNGSYHVLHGTINPLANVAPKDIKIAELIARVSKGQTKEVILATSPDVEGEATAMYIASLVKPYGVKVTRIAQGLAAGTQLEFADEVTLTRALRDRIQL